MKTSSVIGLLALQSVVFAVVLAGVVAYDRYEKSRIESRADLSEARSKALETQVNVLNEERTLGALRDGERVREISKLKTLNRELTQKVDDQKAAPKSIADHAAGIPFAMAGDASLPKTGLTLPQQILKQMGNVEIRSNGFGINGSITLNGETIKFGDVERLQDDMLKDILNELERPAELQKPIERAEKGEQF